MYVDDDGLTMAEYLTLISDFISSTFFDPRKRVFVGYLLSALVLAVLWLVLLQRQRLKPALAGIFSAGVWWSVSARTDYALLVGNRLVMALLSPLLLGQLVVATFWFEGLHGWLSPQPVGEWPVWAVTSLFTVTLFLLDDASRYLLHRCLHQSAILWRFHRVHHTATTLTPLTIFRSHPVEGILFSLRSALVQGFCIGVFVFVFGAGVDLVSVLGVSVLLFVLNACGANLRHSMIAVYYPRRVERWLISPAQHQIHHSTDPRHFDRNFGVFLAVWDRLGGTLHYSERNRTLDFGIKERGAKVSQPLWQVYWLPFRKRGGLFMHD